MQFTRIITLLATLAGSSFAGVVYDFSYVPTYGTVSEFAWRMTSPTYLTDSTSLTFTPFDMPYSTGAFTLSKATLSSRCFTFASAGTSLGQCTASPSPGNGLIQFSFMDDFNAPGTYTSMLGVAGGVTSGFKSVNGGGIVTLIVSDDEGGEENPGGSGGSESPSGTPSGSETPEPASMALFGAGLLSFGIVQRLRRKSSNQ